MKRLFKGEAYHPYWLRYTECSKNSVREYRFRSIVCVGRGVFLSKI
ncbi:MAG: hypothetical protein LBJ00_10620 [Planctomycetaceae bacterium]|nr:hypothetical protein [Planctomycetaceae bacterium]